jgi:tellurite resistance protein TerC
VAVLTVILQLIFLECILSIDNAAVMGAMVAHLPNDKPTPWPAALRPLFGWSDRLLGNQRSAALKVGLFGAYAGRILMLALAAFVMQSPWMQIVGALYLVHLAADHFGQVQIASSGSEHVARVRRGGFWSVVLALNLADMAFSLDNVVAAVALSDQFWVVALGVGVGIVMMRFAAVIFTRLMAWEPALEHAAYLLLLAIGAELLLAQTLHIETGELLKFAISLGILLLTVLFARVPQLRAARVVFRPAMLAFAAIHVGLAFVLSSAALLWHREG